MPTAEIVESIYYSNLFSVLKLAFPYFALILGISLCIKELKKINSYY